MFVVLNFKEFWEFKKLFDNKEWFWLDEPYINTFGRHFSIEFKVLGARSWVQVPENTQIDKLL